MNGVKGISGGHSPAELRSALQEAYAYPGLSLIHLPVFSGNHELNSLRVRESWNVGNWRHEVQAEHHRLGL